jgi:hypothetical protein
LGGSEFSEEFSSEYDGSPAPAFPAASSYDLDDPMVLSVADRAYIWSIERVELEGSNDSKGDSSEDSLEEEEEDSLDFEEGGNEVDGDGGACGGGSGDGGDGDVEGDNDGKGDDGDGGGDGDGVNAGGKMPPVYIVV